MIVHGIDLDDPNIEPLFPDPVSGRVLILDADALAYKAASTRKTLDGAYKQFIRLCLTESFLTNATHTRAHLTANENLKSYRDKYPTLKPYQGNRSGKMPPALLRPLRNYLSQPLSDVPENFEILMHYEHEADDHMIIDSEFYRDNGLTWSEDKDLRQTRWPYWERDLGIVDTLTNDFGYVKESFTEGGTRKAIGHGTAYFWCQMLMGDTADHVRGIDKLNGKNCGAKAAIDYIQKFTDENECANDIIWNYAKIGQDVLAEAQCLWLRRSLGENAFHYLMSLDLDKKLREWVIGLHKYHAQLMEDDFVKANPISAISNK